MSLLKKRCFSALFLCLVTYAPLYAGGIACPPEQIDEAVQVNYVYDGDTLQLEDGRKVRLIGIYTPEVHNRQRALPVDIRASGERAKAALQQQLNKTENHVSLAFGSQRFDRTGRTLAHVFLADGTNLQAWLIEQGYAIAFTTPPNDRMASCYQKQEALARQARRGVWQLPQYSLKSVSGFSNKSTGFYRVQATVDRVWETRYGMAFLLGGLLGEMLEIRIYNSDLHNFNAHMLNNLQGKNVRVRGWLRQKKSTDHAPYEMILRHPDAIKMVH